MKKVIRISSVALVLLGSAFIILFLSGSKGRSTAPASRFDTIAVTRGNLEKTVASTGTLAAVETVEIGTEVSGTIEKLLVDFNDRVKKGQILAVLKQDIFAASVADGEATLARAEADLTLAERELERNRPLFEKGYLSEQEFLPYQINADKARAFLSSARANLVKEQTNLDNTVIRSPIDGTVIQRSVDAGQTVAASLNTPTLFVIARDLKHMQIEADVDETDIGQIRQGQTAHFTVQAYPERTFAGIVRQVRLQPEVVSSVVTYTVIVDAPNEDGLLLPGMTATVDFVVKRAENALLVPNAALRFTPPGRVAVYGNGDGQHVFSFNGEGRLKPVAVSTGSSDGQLTVITEGNLNEGVKVVTGLSEQNEQDETRGFSLLGALRGGPRR